MNSSTNSAREGGGSLQRWIRHAAEALAGWVPLAAIIAVSPGVFVWGLQHRDSLVRHFVSNRLPTAQRSTLLVQVLGAALVVAAVYAITMWRAYALHGRYRAEVPRRLNRALAFLVALPLSLAFVVGLEAQRPFFLLVVAMLAAIVTAVSAVTLAPLCRPAWVALANSWPRSRLLAPLVVLVMAGLYAARVIDLELTQHRSLQTGAYDLGIYTNILWQSLHGNLLGCSFIKGGTHASAHYDPILILLSPTMLLHRGAETLIVLQGVWVASAAIPVYLLAARTTGRLLGVVFALVFLAHPALHGPSTFDFHSMSLSIPFVVWAVFFLERGSLKAYAVSIALLLLCREDMAIAAGCIGFYAMAIHGRVRLGVATIIAAGMWLAGVKLFAMPDPALLMADSEHSYEYGSYFSGLAGSGGIGGMIASVFANPVYLLSHLFNEKRVLYILVLLVPLAFTPLFGGRRWVLLGYGMIFVLLASREAVFTVGYHYAATALPALFAVAPAGAKRLARFLERSRRIAPETTLAGVGAAMLVAGLLVSSAFGALLPNASFKAGFYPLVRELSPQQEAQYRALLELTRDIPPDAPLTASGFTLPHLATRQRLFHMPDVDDAEWVVVRTPRLPRHESSGVRALRADRETWELVGEREGIAVFRRRAAAPPAEGD